MTMSVDRPRLRPDLADCYERFVAGDLWSFGPLQVRIVEGRKRDLDGHDFGDLRLDVRSLQWKSVGFAEVGLLFDFLYENEHRRYPPRRGFDGGERLRDFLESCAVGGWQWQLDQLADEKAKANARTLNPSRSTAGLRTEREGRFSS